MSMFEKQKQQVLSILVQAAEMGQRAGAYDLATAGVISQAVAVAKEELGEKDKLTEQSEANADPVEPVSAE